MEVTGRLDEHGRAWLPITVRGNRGEATIEAVIDPWQELEETISP